MTWHGSGVVACGMVAWQCGGGSTSAAVAPICSCSPINRQHQGLLFAKALQPPGLRRCCHKVQQVRHSAAVDVRLRCKQRADLLHVGFARVVSHLRGNERGQGTTQSELQVAGQQLGSDAAWRHRYCIAPAVGGTGGMGHGFY